MAGTDIFGTGVCPDLIQICIIRYDGKEMDDMHRWNPDPKGGYEIPN